MQETNKRIPLYKVRDFGEKISVTFDFLRQNWRLWLQLSFYLLLPLSLVQALAQNTMLTGFVEGGILADSMGDMMPSELQDGAGLLISYVFVVLFAVVGSIIVTSMIFSMIRYDREQRGGLNGVTLGDLKGLLLRCMGRAVMLTLILSVASILYLVVIMICASISLWITFFGVVALLVVAIALCLALPVYLFEDDTTVFGAIGRGFILGWLTWGGTFLLLLVVGLIASMVQGVISLPWYIGFIVKTIFTVNNAADGGGTSIWFTFVLYILAVIQCFGSYLTASFSAVALAYQYGNAAEQRDHFSVDEDIEQFENMGESNDEIAVFEELKD